MGSACFPSGMSTPTAPRPFRILGITEEINACQCCGKTNLQKTVAIENLETGEIGYFGTSCAMQPAKCFGFEKREMSRALADFKQAEQIKYMKARRIYKERGGKYETVQTGKLINGWVPEMISRPVDSALWEAVLSEMPKLTF